MEQSHEDEVCLFRIDTLDGSRRPQSFPLAVANFELHRWCKLPPLGVLPFGDFNDFTVTGVAAGLLLLEKGIRDDGVKANIYERDRFLFNPLTKGFTKLPVVPKVKDPFASASNRLRSRMFMAVDKELVTVVAAELSQDSEDSWWLPSLSRILVWHEGSEDWKPLYVPRCTRITCVVSAVFVGGDLFLQVVDDMDDNALPSRDRIISRGSRASDPELIFIRDKEFSESLVLHMFQYKGALRGIELRPATGGCCHIELGTFDYLSRSWQEEEIEMPMQIRKSLNVSLADFWRYKYTFVDVLGDILCIGHRCRGDIYFLYNLLTKQWCECSAKSPANELLQSGKFLWSPKRYDSWKNKT